MSEKRESTTIGLFRKCLENQLLSADECNLMCSFWEELSKADVQGTLKAESLKTFIRSQFLETVADGMLRGEEILLMLQDQQVVHAENIRLSRHQVLVQQQQSLQQQQNQQEALLHQQQLQRQKQRAQAQKQQQKAALQQQSIQQQAQQQQIQQQHQALPDIFNELIAKDAPMDRNKDPNIVFGHTTSQKIIEIDMENTESEQAKKLMREGVVSTDVNDALAGSTSNWYETNLIDYTQLQRAYMHVHSKTGMVPTGPAMRLLSKAVQSHVVKVLSSALQQSSRRSSALTMDEYCKLYVLAAENPALRSELYCMKWGPDVLGALKADEEAAKAAGKVGADSEINYIKQAAAAEALISADGGTYSSLGSSKKRKAGDGGGGGVERGNDPYWVIEANLEKQNQLDFEQLAKLYFVEDCLPGARKSATTASGERPSSSLTSSLTTSNASTIPMNIPLVNHGLNEEGNHDLAAQRSKILASLAIECPIARSSQERKIFKSDMMVALADIKATTSGALLRGLVFSKEKDPKGV